MSRGTSRSAANPSRTSTAVEIFFPFPYFTGMGRASLLNSTSPSCFGELMLNSRPQRWECHALAAASRCNFTDIRSSAAGINLHSRVFHARQHGHERPVDLLVDRRQPLVVDFLAKRGRQPARYIRRLGQVAAQLQIESPQRHLRQRMRRVGRIEQVGIEHRIMPHSGQRDLSSRRTIGKWCSADLKS